MKEHSPKREQPSPTQDAPLSIWGGVRTCPPNSRGRGSAEAAGAPRSAWWIPSGRVGSVPFLNHLGTGEAWLALVVKNLPANAGDVRDVSSIPGLRRSPGGGLPTLVFLPGQSQRQKSLVGYSPWSHKELDMTEAT